jgi:ABC-type sugar transport system permease subunit
MSAIFDSLLCGGFSLGMYLACLAGAGLCGLIAACMERAAGDSSRSFRISLVVLPMVVCTVILMVNGSVGTGIAVAGAFSLVRFRSVAGKAREIAVIFLVMTAGLACGAGYVVIALVFTGTYAYSGEVFSMYIALACGLIGVPVGWLTDPKVAMAAVIIMSVWAGFGNYMLYFVTGMTSISEDVYESSRIDGANGIQTFFYITLPMLAPVLKVVLMLAITGAFKDYEAIMVLTNGGPGSSTNVMFLYIYNLIFGTGSNAARQIGYGALLSLVAAVIVGAVTIVYNIVAKKLDDVV